MGLFSKPKPPRKPHIAPDSVASNTFFAGIYGISEGEIHGLVDGGKSIFLDGTPLINANGQPNFSGVEWDFRVGTNDQPHIAGFPAVENERSVGVELRHDKPWTKQINNTQLSAVRLRFNWNALRHQHDNGDVTGYRIDYAIDVQTDGGSFIEVLKTHIHEKTSQGYKRSYRIELPKAKRGWTVRVRRLTANQDIEQISDRMSIEAITEIIDAKLRYPNTALLSLRYDAQIFSNVAKMAVLIKGKIIAVPSNYNAEMRTYTGIWDGTFQRAYSNNPAWIFYDICTNKRYGLGEHLADVVDKWQLYQIAQYCDELVDDGKGGKEPRFTCNVYLQKQEDAYTVLRNLASIFRAMMYYDGEHIVVDVDAPKDPEYTFSAANVVAGSLKYGGTRARDRHTIARVAWDNPDNEYKTEHAFVRDEEAIARLGIRFLEINAFGCTSLGQAQRAGLWALKSEQLETRTVVFKTGLQGFIPKVGQVINIADNLFAGRAISGRIVAISTRKRSVILDRPVTAKAGDTLVVNGSGGIEKRRIVSIADTTAVVDSAFKHISTGDIWAIDSDSLRMMQFRILSIEQDDTVFTISALQYERQKYAVVDDGAYIVQNPISVLNPKPIDAPNSVVLSSHNRVVQGQNVSTLTINWSQVDRAAAYIVEWRKDDGNWMLLPKTANHSVDVDGVYAGNYMARVRAVDAFDNESLATLSQPIYIAAKTSKPPKLARLTATGLLFAMRLDWLFNKGSEDTSYTEIQVSPDGRSNIAILGQFAYPTNSHTINGLQGNLTQFYRAKIVDKLGNTSDWTAWVSGRTDANATKVLTLLSGQINQSQLHRDLYTPIAKILPLEQRLGQQTGKIATLETAVAGVNGQLGTLNQSLATAQRELNTTKQHLATAQNTLSTAVANISTERNRITSAIRDITALQSANTAKTQEITNLTQTVGGHTSSIRELGVTTGDLAQKYAQIKTQADNATSEISTIKQTQAGQATSIERLGAKFDSLAVGGRNLLLDSGKTKTGNYGERYQMSVPPKNGDDVIVTLWGELDEHHTGWYLYNTSGTRGFGGMTKIADSIWQMKLKWREEHGNTHLNIYQMPNGNGNRSRIDRIKMELGNTPTDWTPAPEDVQADIDTAKTQAEANINTVRETLTNADIALGRKIDAASTEFKQADNIIKASVQAETQARTNADNAITQIVNALKSDYNNNKSSVASQIKTLSDKDKATATQISQITASVAQAQQAANTANSKADDGIRRANNAQNKADTADAKATQAQADITAEQKARADSESSLARQMSALDSKFTNADNAIKASVAQAQQTATNAQQAVATAQSQISARFDNLAVGGRNLLKNSSLNIANANYEQRFELTQAPNVGEEVVVTLWGEMGADRTGIGVYNTQGRNELFKLVKITDGVYQGKGTWKLPMNGSEPRTPNDTHLNVYFYPHTATSQNHIEKIKLEKGNIGTDWTPAPEDIQSQLDEKASTASLDEYKQAQTSKEQATAQHIAALDAAYKQADSNVIARLAREEQARANAQQAILKKAQEIGAQIAQNKAQADQRMFALANQDTAILQQLQTMQSQVSNVNELTNWRSLAGQQDLNNLKVPGNYYLTGSKHKNAPQNNVALYVVVSKPTTDRIIQTAWVDDANNARYTRIYHGVWHAWKKLATNTDLENKADAGLFNDLRSTVYTINGQVTTQAKVTQQIQTELHGQRASIQQQALSIDGLYAQYMLKLDVNGRVVGYGLANGGGIADFAVIADKFYIASPDGQSINPFIFTTTSQVINGVTIPAGAYIKDAFIANASIDTLKVAGNAITVPRAQNFYDSRTDYSGQPFTAYMAIEAGTAVVLSATFFINATASHTDTRPHFVTATALLNKKLEVSIWCNDELVVKKEFLFFSENSKSNIDNMGNGNREVTATAVAAITDKMVGIVNFVHIAPTFPIYSVKIQDVSVNGNGSYTITQGSFLAFAAKR